MKTVLFYSFKGGVGRTQLLINTAKYLAEKENKKIAIVDFDIYAPGISYMNKFENSNQDSKYLIDFLLNTLKAEDIESLYFEKENNLFIFPCGNVNNFNYYHTQLNELSEYAPNLKHSAEERKTEILTNADYMFDYFRDKIEESLNKEIDYLFIDSRTGITEISDIFFSSLVSKDSNKIARLLRNLTTRPTSFLSLTDITRENIIASFLL